MILPYTPFLKQAKFHASAAPFRLFGGSAGGGKSEAILWEGVIKCLVKPKTNGVLFRKTFPELEMSLIRRFLEKCPIQLYKYDSRQHLATFPNGSILQFAYCDSEKDVYKYQSAEFDFIGIDELTHFTEYVFTYLLSRLRTTKINITPSFFAATNPGNIGHSFCKSRWVDKDCKLEGYNSADYDFIPATVQDNPALIKNDPDYLKRLENLPEQEKKALLYGSWEVFAGQFFREWFKEKHVVQPFQVPTGWKKFRAYDHGRENPACCVWGAVDYDGRVWIYREYYKTGQNIDQIANDVLQLSGDEMYYYSVADPSIFAKTGFVDSAGGQTIAEGFARHGIVWQPASNRRVDGWNLIHQYLYWSEQRVSKLVLFDTCVNGIKTIPAAIHDRNRPEDIGGGIDHNDFLDALRYGLMALHEQQTPAPKTDVERKLDEFKRVQELNVANLGNFYYPS